jgi:hypothetical protein
MTLAVSSERNFTRTAVGDAALDISTIHDNYASNKKEDAMTSVIASSEPKHPKMAQTGHHFLRVLSSNC